YSTMQVARGRATTYPERSVGLRTARAPGLPHETSGSNMARMRLSPLLALQRVARECQRENIWPRSHPVRSHPLVAPCDLIPISVREHHTVHCSLLTSFLRNMIGGEEAEHSSIRI